MTSKYLVFEVAGDPMKDLTGTAVVANLKKKYSDREIIVTTFWPEIWLHNPDVYRVYKLGNTSYFYDDFIRDKNTLIFRLDPYLEEDFIYRRRHLIEIWSDLCGVSLESQKPTLHFTGREFEAVGKMTNRGLPLFIFETRALLNKPVFDPWQSKSSIDSLPFQTIMAVVNAAKEKGFFPLHLKRVDEPSLPGIEWLDLSLRQMLCAISLGQKNLLLNSFGRQVAAAFNLPAAVVSSEEDSRTFGYENEIKISQPNTEEIIKQIL